MGESALIGYDNCLIFSPLNAHPAVKFVINHPQRDVFGEIFTTNVTYISSAVAAACMPKKHIRDELLSLSAFEDKTCGLWIAK